MKILITGGAGYIGSHVLKALLKQGGHEITVVDNLCKGTTKALDALEKIGKFKFVKANLEDDLSGIFAEGKFDAIIHFAAFIEVFETIVKNLDKVKKDIQPESILNFEKDDLVQVSSIKGSVAIRKYLNEKGVMIKSLIKIVDINKHIAILLVDGDEKILSVEDAVNIMVRKNAL